MDEPVKVPDDDGDGDGDDDGDDDMIIKHSG